MIDVSELTMKWIQDDFKKRGLSISELSKRLNEKQTTTVKWISQGVNNIPFRLVWKYTSVFQNWNDLYEYLKREEAIDMALSSLPEEKWDEFKRLMGKDEE